MKLSINLLPSEYAVVAKEQRKFSIVQWSSVGVILFLFFLASIAVALRFFQVKNIQNRESGIKTVETRILDLKEKEAALAVLKSRLTSAATLTKAPSKELTIFNFLTQVVPPTVTLSSVTIDKGGGLLFSALVPNTDTLGQLLNILTDQAAFNTVKKVEMESLSRGKDGTFRINFNITPK
jgi:Tfp pilus assembly protein PilN